MHTNLIKIYDNRAEIQSENAETVLLLSATSERLTFARINYAGSPAEAKNRRQIRQRVARGHWQRERQTLKVTANGNFR